MNEKRKWVTAGRLRRGAAVLGALGLLTAGAGVLMAGSALAAVGTLPGDLALNPTTGLLTSVPGWSTTVACPSNANVSAQVDEYSLSGTLITSASGNQTANLTNPTGFTGSGTGLLVGSVGGLLNIAGINASNPGTVEWVVDCYSGGGESGTEVHAMSIYVTLPASAPTTYTTSASAPSQTATPTTLMVSPNTGVNTTTGVTLTATVTAADGTAPTGTVTFYNTATSPATVIGNASYPVTWTATAPFTGSATTGSITFPTAGTYLLDAVFTPASQVYATTTSAVSSLTVAPPGQDATCYTGETPACSPVTNPVVINVTAQAQGSLTVTVAAGPVTLSNSIANPSPATGTLPNVSIKDTRNSYPGWSVSGLESAFTSSALPSTPISGSELGWTPASAGGTGTFDGTHVVLGLPTTSATTGGLGAGAVLALAHAGYGADPTGATTYIANAALSLVIPVNTTAGAYSGNLTITYLQSQS